MNFPQELITKLNLLPTPSIIAISGVGGSGKSTIANDLGTIVGAQVISIDSFQKDGAFDTTYKLWEIMDFERLEKEVFIPFTKNENVITYGHFDPKIRGISKTIEFQNKGKLIIEGVGLFRPELLKYFRFKIWIDCPIEVAIERGKKRDRDNGSPVDALWEGVWKENDIQYVEVFNPISVTDFILSNNN